MTRGEEEGGASKGEEAGVQEKVDRLVEQRLVGGSSGGVGQLAEAEPVGGRKGVSAETEGGEEGGRRFEEVKGSMW